jgi:hypothetical protein
VRSPASRTCCPIPDSALLCKLKRIAFGSGVVGGTDLQQDGTQTLSIATSPNLTVTRLTASGTSPIELNGSAQVSGGLTVAGLSQLQGLEASGVVAQQVVWVTGAGAPAQSIMFPCSLQLGTWRLRGTDAGQAVLERFDEDGSIQTGGWVPFTSFIHDPDTNGAALGSEAVRTDTLSPLSQAADAAVRCEGHLICSGRFTANGVQMANGSAVIPGMLTVGGVNVADALAAREPTFTAVAPLYKAINFQTAEIELRVDTAGLKGLSPVFCGGRVDGATASPLSSVGRVSYTVSRPSGQAQGVWAITFGSPAASNN